MIDLNDRSPNNKHHYHLYCDKCGADRALSNLQPKWAFENLSKNNHFVG